MNAAFRAADASGAAASATPAGPAAGFAPRPAGRILFLADCHLGVGSSAEDRAREERVLSFLKHEAPSAAALYVLGDLFDFWFEYRHAVPRDHFRVLSALACLIERGVPVTFFGGNHDFWVGSFLESEIGCRVAHGPLEVVEQGRRIFLAHGDGLAPGDRGYLFLRGLLRHPWAIAAYRWLHPDLGIPLARAVSRLSRTHRDVSRFEVQWLRRHIAEPRFAAGADAVLIGHVHQPAHVSSGGRDFLVLGDWVTSNAFAVLEAGRFSLLRWQGDHAESAGPVIAETAGA